MSKANNLCCEELQRNITDTKVIQYCEVFDEYGIIVPEDGISYILIHNCPWCGKALPSSKRMRWFDELENMGYENPLMRDDLPVEFMSNQWYQSRDIK
jgi:hypothetical protein